MEYSTAIHLRHEDMDYSQKLQEVRNLSLVKYFLHTTIKPEKKNTHSISILLI